MPIVLFTDFGSTDPYVGQVKAVLGEAAPAVPIIDLLNDAPELNAKAGAHLLSSLVGQFPQGSVFLAVVDPGVGGRRAAVVVRADGYRLVGPDNGLLSVFAARAAHVQTFRIAWRPKRLSSSFHGRDLFGPVAAHVALDDVPEGWLVPLPRLSVDFGADDLSEIVYVDHYGNAVSGVRAAAVSRDATLLVNGRRLRHGRVFSDVPGGELFWYENSQGLVEIAANQASAAKRLKLRVGTRIRWTG